MAAQALQSAKDKLAKLSSTSPAPPEPPKPSEPSSPTTPTEQKLDEDGEPIPATPTPEPTATPKPADAKTAVAATTDKGKKSKWQLLDQFKARTLKAEARALELESKIGDPATLEAASQRATAAEKRLAELEEHIRYVDYSRSSEFAEKYQKPYEEAWTKAVNDLKELSVTTADGTTRAATAQDLLHLANLPLGEARKLANEVFGDAADDVMAHRRRVKELSEAQEKALTDAKINSKQWLEQSLSASKKLADEIKQLWTTETAAKEAKYEFLKPKDGDDEWNEILERSTELVESAYASNARDPKLTPEQRAEVIRKHSAVHARARAYGPLRLELKRLRAQLAERDAKLKQYEGSEPTVGNGAPRGIAPTGSGIEGLKSRLASQFR